MNVRTQSPAGSAGTSWAGSLLKPFSSSASPLTQDLTKVPSVPDWAAGVSADPSTEMDPLAAASRVATPQGSQELKDKFQQFVAGTFYQRMIASMRLTVKESKLMHGGRAEEIFRQQLDMTMADQLAASHGADLAGKLYEQFLRQNASAASSASGEDRVDVQRSPGDLRILGSSAATLDRLA